MHKDKLTGQEVIDYDFMGKGIRPPKKMKVTDAGKEFEKLFREMDFLFYKKTDKKNSNMYSASGRGRKPQNQICTAKMYYGDNLKNHIEFLRKYMPQQNKDEVTEKPKLFNGSYDIVPEEEIRKYESEASELYFKYIISPESQNVPLKLLVRSFVKNLEKLTGYHFSWMAVEHHNTDHAHAHLLLNGKDKKTGEDIRIPKEIIKSARITAGELCTKMIGNRTPEQIEASRKRLPEAKRYTILDDRIEKYCIPFPSIRKPSDDENEYEAEIIARDEEMKKRLSVLCQLGIARCYSRNIPPLYYLERNWKNKLKNIGRYNTFVEARRKLRWTTACNLKVFDRDAGNFKGVVTQRFIMDDENVFNNAIVVENRQTGEAYYVRTHSQPDEEIIGSAVELSYKNNSKGRNVLHLRVMNSGTGKEKKGN